MTTADVPTPKPRSRWPLGLLGMLALVAAAERCIASRYIDLGTMYTIEWRLTSKALPKQAPKAEILCFGTSLSRLGISPLILQDRTGLPAYNLALSGGQPYSSYLMLRRALDAGAHPKAIVVDFKWTSIANSPTMLERVLPEVGTLAECGRLAFDLRDGSFLGRISMVKLLPSFAYRVQLRDNVVAAVGGKEPNRNEQWATMARNMRVNKGSHHAPRAAYKGNIDPKDEQFFPPKWSCHPVNELYIHKFLDLAGSRGIPVFVLIPPVAPAAQARLDEVGASDRYTRFIEGVLADHPGATALDARGAAYPVDALYDSSHLNRFGTADLSNALGDVLKASLGGAAPTTRIAALPAYAGGVGQERLEDFIGSHTQIAQAQKARDEQARRVAAGADSGTRR